MLWALRAACLVQDDTGAVLIYQHSCGIPVHSTVLHRVESPSVIFVDLYDNVLSLRMLARQQRDTVVAAGAEVA